MVSNYFEIVSLISILFLLALLFRNSTGPNDLLVTVTTVITTERERNNTKKDKDALKQKQK